MSTRDEEALLRLAEAVAQGTPVDWAREVAAQPELRPELEQLRALEAIAALPRNAAPDPLIGRTLSHYRIRERLGAGGMGVVYRAEDQRLHRPVALKVLPPELVASEERRRRLLREARAGAAVVHPSVAAVYEIGEDQGTVFVAMELVEGETLHERIAGGPLPLGAALPIATEMADGLAAAHQAHLIHRDLKPANVVIRPDGHVKILDFGLAKLVEAEKTGESESSRLESLPTQEGRLLGTPAYMSPEQVRGEPLDVRSDLFSFGSTLYEMVTGQAPFRRASAAETLTAILRDEPTPASRLDPELPPRLEAILGRCLAKEPRDRYPGAGELAAELRALASGAAGVAPALSAPGGELPRRASPRRAWLPLAAGAALLLAVGLVWRLNRSSPEAPPGHSLAVLPFVNLSADPEQEYFADGIAEELLHTVAGFEGLRVIGRTSSFSFRDSDADLKTIGQTLGADVILEGSVRTAGNRVRITAQLVDSQDGIHRWSESYDRELGDVFAIQTEIATAIATALRVELSSEERERLATPPTRNLDAYQAYLLGRQRCEKRTTATTEEAMRYYERAIELDPTFAAAYAGLSCAYLLQFGNSDQPPDEMLARAQAAADRALELDDQLAEAHAALADVKHYRNDFEGAEAAYQRALALNPNSVDANLHYAGLLGGSLARYEESVALLRKAVELDPLSILTVASFGSGLHSLGRFQEGLAWYERALEIDPASVVPYLLIGDHHWLVSGRLDEAVVWQAKVVALDPRSPLALGHLGRLFLELGAPDRAEDWIRRAIELAPENVYANLVMQRLALYRGDEELALYHGRKAFAIWPFDGDVLLLLRDDELEAGRYAEARALYEPLFPELSERDPKVDLRNYRAAIDLAPILSRTGERERAERLLERSVEPIQKRPRLGYYGFGIADVQLYALRGERQKALSALRQAIDEGWRRDWWYWLQKQPDLEPLRDEPEFQAMVEEIRADMAAQLERVREMEARGELVLSAEPPAPSDRRSD